MKDVPVTTTRRLLLAALLLLAPAAGPAAHAEGATADLRPLARRLADEVVGVAYRDFAAAARRNAAAWASECGAAKPSRDGLAAHHLAVARAWWRVEPVRFGPVAEDFRAERIDFWPERRNATARGLAELLDPAAPEPTADTLRSGSAAVQGLPAEERLLFDGHGGLGRRDCAVGRAISANLAAMAGDIEEGWRGVGTRAGADEAFARELVTRLVTDALTGFTTLIDVKLAALGRTAAAARPEALEGRRAGAEREALLAPLEGMADLVAVLVDGREEGATVVATLDTARSVAAGLPARIGPLLADPRERSRVVLLRDALRSAQDAAIADLPALVGTTVGFNSRDGD